MSFTQDELQALNTIFDQKMVILRRELDRSLDQRMQLLRREFEQRQAAVLQDLLRGQTRRLAEQQHRSRDALYQRLEALHSRTIQLVNQELEQRYQQQSQQMGEVVDRALAAQLLAIEQLINQRVQIPLAEPPGSSGEVAPDFDAIEVQTEIPWEDLVELIDKVLVERLQQMSSAVQAKLQELERALVVQLHVLRDQLQNSMSAAPQLQSEKPVKSLKTIQEVFASIEQLERLVESMQVAMTANSALLSNRLYHHQQLPVERAHPRQPSAPVAEPAESDNSSKQDDTEPLPFPRKREDE